MNEHKRYLETGFVLSIVMLLVVGSLGVIASPVRAAITPQWISVTPMGDSRAQAVVVNDGNGLVYVMGGVKSITGMSYDPAVADADSYDPGTGAWTILAPMPVGVRAAAGAYGQDGRVYVIGGVNDSLGVVNLTQIYDPDSDSWSSGAPIPIGSREAKAVAIDYNDYYDEIVVAGGEEAGDQVFIYDISDDAWNPASSMPVALMAGAFVFNGYYSYYFGGVDAGHIAQNAVYRYFPWDGWEYAGDMPVAMAAQAGVRGADGFVYVFGGGTSDGEIDTPTAAGYCVEIEGWTWHALPDMAVPAKYLGAAATPDGRVLSLGGNSIAAVFDNVDSMEVMSVDVTLSKTTCSPGDSIMVTIVTDYAFGNEVGYNVYPYFVDSSGVVFGMTDVGTPYAKSFAFEMTLPVSVAPGSYTLVLYELTGYHKAGGSTITLNPSFPLTVVASYSLEEQLAMMEANMTALQLAMMQAMADANASTMAYLDAQMTALQATLGLIIQGMIDTNASTMAYLDTQIAALQAALGLIVQGMIDTNASTMAYLDAQIAALQMALVMMGEAMADANESTMAYLDAQIAALQAALVMMGEAMADANESTMAYLDAQIATLQAALTAIGNGLLAMGSGQSAAMDDLNLTLADLQTQLDDFQEQIDRIEGKADNSGTLSIVTLVLIIVVVALAAMMFMMIRKKP